MKQEELNALIVDILKISGMSIDSALQVCKKEKYDDLIKILDQYNPDNEDKSEVWREGDVIQIDPVLEESFGASFFIVTKPTEWGANGYFVLPYKQGLVHYKCPFDKGKKIGIAEWVYHEK